MDINENFIPIGDKVLLKKLVQTMDKKYGDILVPHDVDKNCSMGIAQVVNLGKQAKQQLCININDYVLYDYYSVYENNPIYVITKAENIIVQLTKEQANDYMKNYVISNYKTK